MHEYPQLMFCVPGKAEGVTWLHVLTDLSLLTFLQTEQQHNFLLSGQLMFWPRITAPDVLPQKQFKGRSNCEQIVFLVENVWEALLGFPVSIYVCAQQRTRDNFAFVSYIC